MTTKRKVIPKLEIHKRGRLVDSFLLNTPRLVIGSAPGAHIRLRSAEIETEHLVIELVNRRFLEAVNVAGDPHLRHQGDSFERVRLGRGSVITLGPLAFKLVFVPREVEAPTPEPEATPAAPPAAAASVHAEPDAPAPATAPAEHPVSHPTPPVDPRTEPEGFVPPATLPPAVPSRPEPPAIPSGPEPPAIPSGPEPPATPARPEPPVTPVRPEPPTTPARPDPPATPVRPDPPHRPVPAAPSDPGLDDDDAAPEPPDRSEPEATPAPPADPTPEPPTSDEVVAYLLVYPPAGERRKRVRLPTGSFDVGREECDINLFYEGIAARHATLMVMPDGNIYVQDKGSGLPTIVNGQVVNLSPLHQGDRLQIGTVAFDLELVANPATGTSIPPGPGPEAPQSAPGTAEQTPGSQTAAGAGAWVQAAMETPAATDTAQPETGSHPSMPVRRIGKSEREKAKTVGTGTDPHVTAREWVRQAIVDSEEREKDEVRPEEKAPTFAVPPKKARGPRARRQPDTRSGPEKVAAARFPEWATTTIPPEYRARKRRRRILSILVVLIVIGVPTALVAWQRSRDDVGPRGSILGGPEGGDEPDVHSVLANTDGAYGGLRSEDDEDEDRSSRRKKSRRSRRSKDRDRSSSSDDGLEMTEAGTSREGPTYGPGGRITGVDRSGSGWGVDPTSDPDLIAIGNPGPGAPVLQFGSPQLGGMMVEEDDGGGVRRVEELEFELAEDADPSGRGNVDMDEVDQVLSSLTPSVRACYTRALESKPDLSGTMVLILTLSSSGQISSSSLDPNASSLTDVDLKRCVERQVKSRNYPIPEGGQVTFSYPFRFNQP